MPMTSASLTGMYMYGKSGYWHLIPDQLIQKHPCPITSEDIIIFLISLHIKLYSEELKPIFKFPSYPATYLVNSVG